MLAAVCARRCEAASERRSRLLGVKAQIQWTEPRGDFVSGLFSRNRVNPILPRQTFCTTARDGNAHWGGTEDQGCGVAG